jgi:Flp pilus assembly protein TadB
MRFKLFPVALLACMLALSPSAVHAQEGITKKQAEKNLARKAKEEKKAKKEKVKEDRKRHLSIQDEATRKRIKRNTKRAERGGQGRHRDGLLRRMFGGG